MNPEPSGAPSTEEVAAFFQKHRTGLVTLVFTDLVESTRLKQQLGDTRAIALVQQHHARVRDWLSAFPEAAEIETAGDSFLLLFARPSDAARFALGLHTRNRQLSAEAGVKLEDRIGIHAGEVFVQDQAGDAKLFGSQVDVCGRV
jgi:class 3 adenylate cyclase